MNYVDWQQSKDERPLASDGSQAWLAALAALPREELSRMANAIESELEQQRTTSPSRFVIEDSGSQYSSPQYSSPEYSDPQYSGSEYSGSQSSGSQLPSTQFASPRISEPRAPAWLLRARDRRPTRSSEVLNDTGYLTDNVPPPPPPSFLPPALTRRPAPIPRTPTRAEPMGRRVYFAFDFDDLLRVEVVRQSGKVGMRETIQRGFYDRAVWESRALKNEAGLLALMREAVRNSTTVCVLSGANTWRSRWVKYEIARAVIEERGLLAIQIDDIEPNRATPERPGLNPLHVMGLYQHENGHYYLVERHEVVKDVSTGALGFEWRLYADHPEPLVPPRYVGDIEMGRAAPLSLFTAEHDFLTEDGPANMAAWIDDAAAQVGR
jgi:antiphage defense system Thoeris ThsB-like protein